MPMRWMSSRAAIVASVALLVAACAPAPIVPITQVPAAATVVSAAATAAPTVAAAAKPAASAVAAVAPTVVAAVPTVAAAAAAAAGGGTLNIYLYQKPKNWNPLAPPNG